MEQQTIRKSDKFIPWYFVAFFVVLAAMDGVFVYLATSSHTGVVADNAYERGLAYNETIAAAEESAALGWQAELELVGSELQLKISGSDGAPVNDALVNALVSRPTQSGYDFNVPFVPESAGSYSGEAAFPLDGLWNVRVFVEWKQQQFQISKRLVVGR